MKRILRKFFSSKRNIISTMKKLNMIIGNSIYNLSKSFEKLWESYKYLLSLLFLFICIFLLIYFFNEIKSILYFENTATWIGAIASFLAVITALYLNKKQPKLKLGTDVSILRNQDVFISFLNRTKSDGFVKIIDINVIAYKDLKKYKKGKYSIINDEYIRFLLNDMYPFDLKIWHPVSSENITNVYLNTLYEESSKPEYINIQDFLNLLLKEIKDLKMMYKWSSDNKNFIFKDLKLEIGWITNDRSEFAKKTTLLNFTELEKVGIVQNPFEN